MVVDKVFVVFFSPFCGYLYYFFLFFYYCFFFFLCRCPARPNVNTSWSTVQGSERLGGIFSLLSTGIWVTFLPQSTFCHSYVPTHPVTRHRNASHSGMYILQYGKIRLRKGRDLGVHLAKEFRTVLASPIWLLVGTNEHSSIAILIYLAALVGPEGVHKFV